MTTKMTWESTKFLVSIEVIIDRRVCKCTYYFYCKSLPIPVLSFRRCHRHRPLLLGQSRRQGQCKGGGGVETVKGAAVGSATVEPPPPPPLLQIRAILPTGTITILSKPSENWKRWRNCI